MKLSTIGWAALAIGGWVAFNYLDGGFGQRAERDPTLGPLPTPSDEGSAESSRTTPGGKVRKQTTWRRSCPTPSVPPARPTARQVGARKKAMQEYQSALGRVLSGRSRVGDQDLLEALERRWPGLDTALKGKK